MKYTCIMSYRMSRVVASHAGVNEVVQRQRLGVERFTAAISHQRASPRPRPHRSPLASDLLPEPLSSDVVARLPQRISPPPQFQQHPQLADRRLRVPLDAADAVRTAESRESPDKGLDVLRDREVRARESRNAELLQRTCQKTIGFCPAPIVMESTIIYRNINQF